MNVSTFVDDLQGEAVAGDRYDPLSIAFHWVTLVLIAAAFWSVWAHQGAQDGATAARLLALHRSLGLVIWSLSVLRVGWRIGGARRPPLPASTGSLQRLAAATMQVLLLALLIFLPLTGFLQSIWRGKAFPLLIGEVPALVARSKPATHVFHDLHETGANALLALIALHALAGLYHGLIRNDGVLGAMLPWRTSPKR